MKYNHEDKRRARIAEPVQVYLDPVDKRRLDRLTERLRTTKSAVLREALQALERQLVDVKHHPALQVMGIAPGSEAGAPDYDLAREHDRFLAGTHDAPRPRKRSGRRGA